MDYSNFEKIIIKRTSYFAIGLFFLIIVCIFALIYINKNMIEEKIMRMVLNVLCCILIIGSLVLGSKLVLDSAYDIKNKAYITYIGNFIVDNDVETKNGTCTLYIPDNNELKLEMDAYELDAGEYHGELIYSRKTKVVLFVEVSQNEIDK